MPLAKNIINQVTNLVELLLAVDVGATFALGLAPLAYVIYFRFWGWPHPYITHWRPLWGTVYSTQLLKLDFVLLCILPITTVVLTLIALGLSKRKVSSWWLFLVLIQFLWGVINYLPIALLLD